jgi:hypothetical protein
VRQAAQAAPAFEAAEVELARRIDAGQLPPLDPGLLTRVAAATVVGLLVLDVLGDPVVDARSCPAPDRIGLLAPVQTLSPIYATGGQPNGSGWLTNSATGGKAKQLDSGSGNSEVRILPAQPMQLQPQLTMAALYCICLHRFVTSSRDSRA